MKANEKENQDPLHLMSGDKNWPKVSDEEGREISILFQYKLLQLYGPLFGIYVVPQLDNIQIWHCLIVIRQGFYKEAKFKFMVHFGGDFPKAPPRVVFISKVYHPLINYTTGELDMALLFPKWNYIQQNLLYTVFNQIRLIFTDQSRLSIQDSLNPEAGHKFVNKIHCFLERIIDCIEDSKDRLYNNYDETSLIFRQEANTGTEAIKAKLFEVCESGETFQDKKKELMDFLMK